MPIEEWLASLDASSDHGVNLMWYFSTLGDPAADVLAADQQLAARENSLALRVQLLSAGIDQV